MGPSCLSMAFSVQTPYCLAIQMKDGRTVIKNIIDTFQVEEKLTLKILSVFYTGKKEHSFPIVITSKSCTVPNTANLDFQNETPNLLAYGILENNQLDCTNNVEFPVNNPLHDIKLYAHYYDDNFKLQPLTDFDALIYVKLSAIIC